MEEVKRIAERLYIEPDSRFSNVILHMLHYPVYSGFDVNSGGLEPSYKEWDYSSLEEFVSENLSRHELSIVIYQFGMISKLTYTTEHMVRMLFTYIRDQRENILLEFNKLFKCYEGQTK